MEAIADRARVRRVTITGSESTGKTTLARNLARHFGTVWVPEFVRSYADEKMARSGLPLDASDVDAIAQGQIAEQDSAASEANGLLVLDTDLLSTAIYARHYYGSCPPWIEAAVRDRLADLYLLCDIDVPWIPDPNRDRPHLREVMHQLFVTKLDALGATVVLIRGSWNERLTLAVRAVESRHPERSEGPQSSR